jgi:hypothetical protein
MIPIEGINYMLTAALKEGTQAGDFYVGLFGTPYTPLPADTAATFPASATEVTAYSETTRVAVTLGSVASGAVDNFASPAEFTGTTDGVLVYGAFVVTAPAKGATVGTLMATTKFNSPKPLDAGTVLRIKVPFSIVSN